jgi:hypothetical protein
VFGHTLALTRSLVITEYSVSQAALEFELTLSVSQFSLSVIQTITEPYAVIPGVGNLCSEVGNLFLELLDGFLEFRVLGLELLFGFLEFRGLGLERFLLILQFFLVGYDCLFLSPERRNPGSKLVNSLLGARVDSDRHAWGKMVLVHVRP